jgi:hypothetical protein
MGLINAIEKRLMSLGEGSSPKWKIAILDARKGSGLQSNFEHFFGFGTFSPAGA